MRGGILLFEPLGSLRRFCGLSSFCRELQWSMEWTVRPLLCPKTRGLRKRFDPHHPTTSTSRIYNLHLFRGLADPRETLTFKQL